MLLIGRVVLLSPVWVFHDCPYFYLWIGTFFPSLFLFFFFGSSISTAMMRTGSNSKGHGMRVEPTNQRGFKVIHMLIKSIICVDVLYFLILAICKCRQAPWRYWVIFFLLLRSKQQGLIVNLWTWHVVNRAKDQLFKHLSSLNKFQINFVNEEPIISKRGLI